MKVFTEPLNLVTQASNLHTFGTRNDLLNFMDMFQVEPKDNSVS